MKLSCPACGASRELADGANHPGPFLRCLVCRVPIEIPEDDFLPESEPPASRLDPENGWYVEVRSGVYGPVTRAGLERWIHEGRVDWEDLVSHGGGPWLPALEQRLIVEHFSCRGEAPAAPERGDDLPPVKVRRPERRRPRVPRGLAIVAGGLLLSSLLTLNLPGLVAGAGLFSLRRWARRAAIAILFAVLVGILAGVWLAVSDSHWLAAFLGAALAGAAGASIGYLLQRRMRGYFQPGGGARACVALALSAVAGAALITIAFRAISRETDSRQIPGNGYAYTITRPDRAWRNVPARSVGGSPEPDLLLAREGLGARAMVIVEETPGDARSCLERAEARIRRTGLDPTVYGAREVYAGSLPGVQEIVSVARGARRVATLITCFADGGQHYQILGVAEEKVFERVRAELARMATGFRLDEVDDPMHLDIQTRGGPAPAGPAPAPGTLAGVIASADAAVVTIASVLDGNDRSYGSGTLLREDGVVVTNHHVVRGARRVSVSIPGFGVRRARVVAVDPDRDLALLKVPGRQLPSLPLTRRPVQAGDDVIAIGSPMGLAHTVTKGIISSTRRIREGVDYLQTDVSVNPGNSGGPLLNDAGEIVGINTFILRESEEVALTGLNFAVAAPYVREMAESNGFALPDPSPDARPLAASP